MMHNKFFYVAAGRGGANLLFIETSNFMCHVDI